MAATYIICYPLFDIYERILFTTDLIKILPSDRESEPEQALAAMTTEAMENYWSFYIYFLINSNKDRKTHQLISISQA